MLNLRTALPVSKKPGKGFTLIELVVVIAILSILFAITLVAINPGRQFAQARDSKRESDVNAILNAVHQYASANNGNLPGAITTTATNMSSVSGDVDICSTIVPTYIAAMPVDPSNGTFTDCTNYNTHYSISHSNTDNRITVTATPEVASVISVTR